MKKLKLSMKIIGGFGIVILLTIGVVGIYQFSTIKTTTGFESLLKDDIAIEMHATEAKFYLERALRETGNFLLSSDVKSIDNHKESVDGMIKHLSAIQAIEQDTHPAAAKQVAEILTLVGEYRNRVDAMVNSLHTVGLTENDGKQKEFRDAAHAVQAMGKEHDLNGVKIALLQMRGAEQDFLASPDAYRDKFKAAISAYDAALKSTEFVPPAEAKKALDDTFAAYQGEAAALLADPQTDREAKVAAMATSFQNAQLLLNSVNVSNVMALVLDVRKEEKDYLLRGKDKYVQRNIAAVAKVREAFVKAGIKQEHVDDVTKYLDAYDKAFADRVFGDKKIKEEKAKMQAVVDKIEPMIASVAAEAVAEGETTSGAIVAQAHRLAGIAIAASIATIALALALAFILARSICRPIDKAVKDLLSGAELLAAASGQVSSSSQVLAEGATEQAASLEETSASMEEMSSMTRQNSDNASQADVLMRDSLATIKQADDSMVEMGRSMNEIAEASSQTSKIIKTIDEIAFQTNLLALNAAVEAARAGEAGAGFAVVAEEVRNLAMRSTEAAKNTAALIEGTVSKVNSGKGIVERATAAFSGVTESSAKVASLIGEIASASREQAQGFGQINQAITQMDSVTQQTSATAEESAAAATELNSQSASMMAIVKSLQSLVNGGGGTAHTAVAPQGGAKAKALAPPAATKPSTKSPVRSLPASTSSRIKPASVPVKSAQPSTSTGKVNPNDVIPMDDEGSFEDF